MAWSLWFSLGSNLIFAFASVVFTKFSKKLSALWMSAFKATVALLCFGVATLFVYDSDRPFSREAFFILFASGFMGLAIGDFFLFKGFQRIGAARTLIIFSFQPILIGASAFFIFGQAVEPIKWLAIFLLIACVLTMSYERYRREGRWEKLGPFFAILGVGLDSVGVLFTRAAFEASPGLPIIEANFYRCLGAAVGFIIFSRFFRIDFKRRFIKLKSSTKLYVVFVSFLGTFVALWLYLSAIESGDLAKVTAIVGCGPIFTAIFECVSNKKWPSNYLWLSLVLFLIGFFILIS